jgi:hypothetical protein
VGWSKAYLQLTHTTCLTKYKLKRDEQKQNKEKQKQVLPQKKNFKKIKILPQILFFFFFFLILAPPKTFFFNLAPPSWGGWLRPWVLPWSEIYIFILFSSQIKSLSLQLVILLMKMTTIDDDRWR